MDTIVIFFCSYIASQKCYTLVFRRHHFKYFFNNSGNFSSSNIAFTFNFSRVIEIQYRRLHLASLGKNAIADIEFCARDKLGRIPPNSFHVLLDTLL